MLLEWRVLAYVALLGCAVYCCNPGQLSYHNLCYETFDVLKNYNSASLFCKSVEGELADVNEFDEDISLIQNRWNLQLQTPYYVQDSKVKPHTSSCPIINASGIHFAVVDSDCETEHSFVCQYSKEVSSAYCKEGTYRYKSICYSSLPTAASYAEAARLCVFQYGQLAILSDTEKQQFISSLKLANSTYWAGVKKVNDTFKWENDEDLDVNCETCKNSSIGEECVHFTLDPFSWSTTDCSTKAYALCETAAALVTTTAAPSTIAAALSCPHGYHWKHHEDSGWCFWETTYETEKASWYGARELCARYGGDLASYQDRHQEVMGIGGASAHTKGLWIGLKRSTFDDVFRWSDGTASNYSNWDVARGEPIRSRTKFCVMHGENDSKWRVDYCGVRRWFVCKAPRVSRPLVPDPPTDKKQKCLFPDDAVVRDWSLYDGHCYLIHKSAFSWHTARTFCRDNEAHLTSVHSFSETDFLLTLGTGNGGVNYWIGGAALHPYDSLSWSDATPVGFVYWNEEQGQSMTTRTLSFCLSFNDRDGSWTKENCNKLQGAICERPLNASYMFASPPPTAILTGFCPNGTYTSGNKCYKLIFSREEKPYPQKLTFDDAKASCLENGATLASLHSQEEQDFVSDLILELGSEAWIGLKGSDKGTLFNWLDYTRMDYTNWGQDEPSTSDNSDELCVSMKYSSDNMGQWSTSSCTSHKSFICQMPKNPMLREPPPDPFLCPDMFGWMKIGASCFGFFDEDERAGWLQAQARCRQLDANLVAIHNFGITLFLKRRLADKKDVYWTGMRETSKNKYQALNGQPLTYSNWLQKQPQRVSERRNCIAVDTQGNWMVRDCDERHPFICQQTSEKEMEIVDYKDLNCPENSDKWRDLGGDLCYLVTQSRRSNWYEATAYCYRQGGYLASFHSEKDILEILKLLSKTSTGLYYIGLGKLDDGSYKWVDRSPVDYTYWDFDEPSSYRDCVVMKQETGKWKSYSCSSVLDFICSAPKVSATRDDDAEESEMAQAVNSSALNESVRNQLEVGGILGIVICFAVLLAIVGVGAYYLCPSTRMQIRLREPESP